jgi:hypothetical protein
MSSGPKPRPKYLGSAETHPLEHAADVEGSPHEDELVGASPHGPEQDRRAEEPFGEMNGTTET